MTDIRIDGDRLRASLTTMATIGATPTGGACRLAPTDLDRVARDLFVRWCAEAGCAVVDRAGDLFARRAGRNDALAAVGTGSRVDRERTGRRFDATYGVLAGLEVIRTLNDHGIETERPIEVSAWADGAGSRAAPGTVAPGVHADACAVDCASTRADGDGDGGTIVDARGEPVGGRTVHAFFEIRVERDPIREADGWTVGVVTEAEGRRQYELTLTEADSHAGPAPRRALHGAAKVVELVDALALAHAPRASATVGLQRPATDARKGVPAQALVTVDFGGPDDALATMDAALEAGVARIAAADRLEHDLRRIACDDRVPFDPGCVALVRDGARRLGHATRDIVSNADHVACRIAKSTPTAMIVVPCPGGLGRDGLEDAARIEAGGDVLLHAMLAKANELPFVSLSSETLAIA